MSNFIRSLADDELRVRQGQAFSGQQSLVGDGINLNHIVLFNNAGAGRIVVLTQILYATSVANQPQLFALSVNPNLTSAAVVGNRLIGGPASVSLWQGASAAGVAVGNQLAQFNASTAVQVIFLSGFVFVIPNGTGVDLQTAVGATTQRTTWFWYELPA